MAKYKVLKTFRDKETKEVHESGAVINLTVKRAEEVSKNLDTSFLERVEENDNKGTGKNGTEQENAKEK